jgi:hypothetical protein
MLCSKSEFHQDFRFRALSRLVWRTSRLGTSPRGLDPDREFYWLGSRARAGREGARVKARVGPVKSCFEPEARGQPGVHRHVNFLLCG